MRVKICGITRTEDALAAAQHGAWALGFIFYKGSPRYIEPNKAGEIIHTVRNQNFNKLYAVGVFVNAPLETIEETVKAASLNRVQLHGEESPDFCHEVQEQLSVRVIKAIQAKQPQDLKPYEGFDILIDAFDEKQRGGTGKVADWDLASQTSKRIILAGGLNANNIVEAIKKVNPFAVDISSGVEDAPGIKDPNKMQQLFETLKREGL